MFGGQDSVATSTWGAAGTVARTSPPPVCRSSAAASRTRASARIRSPSILAYPHGGRSSVARPSNQEKSQPATSIAAPSASRSSKLVTRVLRRLSRSSHSTGLTNIAVTGNYYLCGQQIVRRGRRSLRRSGGSDQAAGGRAARQQASQGRGAGSGDRHLSTRDEQAPEALAPSRTRRRRARLRRCAGPRLQAPAAIGSRDPGLA